MPRATEAQRLQRELAWMIFQLRGARSNLYPRRLSKLPDNIFKRLQSLCTEIEEIEKLVQRQLQLDSTYNSFRRAADKPQKEPSR